MFTQHKKRAQADLRLLYSKIKVIQEIIDIIEVKESVLFTMSIQLPLSPSVPKNVDAGVYTYLKKNPMAASNIWSWPKDRIVCWPENNCIQYVLLNKKNFELPKEMTKIKKILECTSKNSLLKTEDDKFKEMHLVEYNQGKQLISLTAQEKEIFFENLFRERNQYYTPLLASLGSAAYMLERAINVPSGGNAETKSLLLIAIYQEIQAILSNHQDKQEIKRLWPQIISTSSLIVNDLSNFYSTQPVHYIGAGAATGGMLAAKYLFFPRNAFSMKVTGLGLFLIGGATIAYFIIDFFLRQEKKLTVSGAIVASTVSSLPTLVGSQLNELNNNVKVELYILNNKIPLLTDRATDKLNETVDNRLGEIKDRIKVHIAVAGLCSIM